jgi:hypothetical protein
MMNRVFLPEIERDRRACETGRKLAPQLKP